MAGWLAGWLDDAEARIQQPLPDRAPCLLFCNPLIGTDSFFSSSSLPCERPRTSYVDPGLPVRSSDRPLPPPARPANKSIQPPRGRRPALGWLAHADGANLNTSRT
ncbi:hypothetical protein CGRA01v4_03670 [Colletotrichum graminicola]|nr:hypothetical protein CGRA01v4_03670 [Colletotrichum graminicola]